VVGEGCRLEMRHSVVWIGVFGCLCVCVCVRCCGLVCVDVLSTIGTYILEEYYSLYFYGSTIVEYRTLCMC
jgi:hypothetical protein